MKRQRFRERNCQCDRSVETQPNSCFFNMKGKEIAKFQHFCDAYKSLLLSVAQIFVNKRDEQRTVLYNNWGFS